MKQNKKEKERVMRVGIDARLIVFPGIGRYIKCLIEGLDEVLNAKTDIDIEVVVYLPNNYVINVTSKKIFLNWTSINVFSISEHFYWLYVVYRDKLDCLHVPHFIYPVLVSKPIVNTIHDLVYYRFRHNSKLFNLYYKIMHYFVKKRSSYVIAVSEFTRNELLRLLKLEPYKIKVVRNAPDVNFSPQPEDKIRNFKKVYGLPSDFLLYVGTNKPWKNLRTLLLAIRNLRMKNIDYPLVIAGKTGKNEEKVDFLIREIECDNVFLLGELPDDALPLLYSSAKIVLCPSVYEGFGLVPLEAMSCGTPVISSNSASLPEVVSNYALLVDPYDIDGWVDAIVLLWENNFLREELRNKALAWANSFSIEHMATEVLDVYFKILKNR